MTRDLPNSMRALVLDACNVDAEAAVLSLKVGQRAVPRPRRGQVLVRIEAAPCNPSDLLCLQGKYGVFKTPPFVPGWEGAGKVVASGGGVLARWMNGKRVACGVQGGRDGTWAQYVVANATECIPLKRHVTYEQGATLIVNPMTAWALMDLARRGGHQAGVQTAGASQVGRMVLSLAREAGFPLISIVRRDEQVELLKSLGATHVLNSTDREFPNDLRSLCGKLKATVAFEAVAGNMTGMLLNAMPPGAVVHLYGALAEEACGNVNPIDLIFHDKQICGFYLANWVQKRGPLRSLQAANRLQKLLADARLETAIRQRVELEDAAEAMGAYVRQMTDGKILIQPNMKN